MTVHDVLALSWRDAGKSLEGSFEAPEIPETDFKRQVGYILILVRQHEDRTLDSPERGPVLETDARFVVKVFGEVNFLEPAIRAA